MAVAVSPVLADLYQAVATDHRFFLTLKKKLHHERDTQG
jgi:hypothetical protein